MTAKVYDNFYECIEDMESVLGVSSLKDMHIAIKFAEQSGFTSVAEYFKRNVKRLEWNVKKEYEDARNTDTSASE
jgi:hypothetical protein